MVVIDTSFTDYSSIRVRSRGESTFTDAPFVRDSWFIFWRPNQPWEQQMGWLAFVTPVFLMLWLQTENEFERSPMPQVQSRSKFGSGSQNVSTNLGISWFPKPAAVFPAINIGFAMPLNLRAVGSILLLLLLGKRPTFIGPAAPGLGRPKEWNLPQLPLIITWVCLKIG